VTSVELSGDTFTAAHPINIGKVIATVTIAGTPAIVSLRPNTYTPSASAKAGAVENVAPVGDPSAARVVVKELAWETGLVDDPQSTGSAARPICRKREPVPQWTLGTRGETDDPFAAQPAAVDVKRVGVDRDLVRGVGLQQLRGRDDRAQVLARQIAKRLHAEGSYTGRLKVVVLRETRSVEYAK